MHGEFVMMHPEIFAAKALAFYDQAQAARG